MGKISSLPLLDADDMDGLVTVPVVQHQKTWRSPVSPMIEALAEPSIYKARLAAATAESVVGPTYATIAAGLAATIDGQSFAVDGGGGTVFIYRNVGGSAVFQRRLATAEALGAADGAFLIGLPSGTVGGKLAQFAPSIADVPFGAIEGRSPDNAAHNGDALDAALAAADDEVYLPSGDWVVAQTPNNPTAKHFTGPGRLSMVDPDGGFHQLTTYADRDIVVGREYLVRVYARLSIGPSGLSTQLNIAGFGDSTMEGFLSAPAIRNGYFLFQNIMPRLLRQEGVHNVIAANHGVSGTSWVHFDALSHISADTDLVIIKYGINDRALDPSLLPREALAAMAVAMDAKLAELREARGVETLAIILMGPNATKDQVNGRNEEWYEQLRALYVMVARKHACCFFDTYAYLRDARSSGLFWLDATVISGEVVNVHPLDNAAQWIWGGMVRHVFPRHEHSYWAANNFTVRGELAGPVSLTKMPIDYVQAGEFGNTREFVLEEDGFPATGFLDTRLSPDRYAVQELFPLAINGRKYTRFAANAAAWGGFWTGFPVPIVYSNGWGAGPEVDVAPFAVRDESGEVTIGGSFADGDPAANTMIGALPLGFRPPRYAYGFAIGSEGQVIPVRFDADGAIYLLAAGDPLKMVLHGSFTAA
jgi:hypothetical protein